MPNSTLRVHKEEVEGVQQFKRLYCCLGPLKDGFKKGCRPFIGVDGCFLKGPFPGQLLSAVGIDANNGMYPFAYAVVEKEIKVGICSNAIILNCFSMFLLLLMLSI